MTEDHLIAAITQIKGMTAPRAKALLKRFGGAQRLYDTPDSEFRAFANAPAAVIDAFLKARAAKTHERVAEQLALSSIFFLSIYNPLYPALLAASDDAPLGLYMRGELPPQTLPHIAIIGSRRCSDYGMSAAEDIAKGLAARGAVVVSGMARGIDGKAHEGALSGGGKTVAVLGCGVDVCYPPEHKRLMGQIAQSGAVVSEYPPGSQPDAYRFPARNRIISGLCSAVLVVESEERSGTSITVARALEQGRAVLAVPGSIYSKYSRGTNYLIYLGATPVTSADEALFELRKAFPSYAEQAPRAQTAEKPAAPAPKETFDKTEELVYSCIDREPKALDDILRQTALPISKLRQVLLELELDGRIKRLPGERYSTT